MFKYLLCVLVLSEIDAYGIEVNDDDEETATLIDVVDLTHPTTMRVVAEYYGAVERKWKICLNCGIPGLGTVMHLEHEISTSTAMYPAVIPTEYLLTRLAIIDVSSLVKVQPKFVLSLDVALQWIVLRNDPKEPTLLLFKFGWKYEYLRKLRSCVCAIPGISFELAEWIAANMTHVVGVATDAPTMESEETRQFNTNSVANILGKSGIYMIENVNIRKPLPERGCMAIAMPIKLFQSSYVPSRLTAFCPATQPSPHQVVLALRNLGSGDLTRPHTHPNLFNEVVMDDLLS